MMILNRQIPLEQIAPWLVSGASGCYIVARARQLSRADASDASWLNFLVRQSDVVLVLCGSPAIWHVAWRRVAARRHARATDGDQAALSAGVAHQLRQVFTVLLLGLGMIRRRASEGKVADLDKLARRLQQVTRVGARLLSALEESAELDLVPASVAIGQEYTTENGRRA